MFMQRTPYALLVKWEHHIWNVQQGLVSCFTSASHRGRSRTEGELMRILMSDHRSLLLELTEVRVGALQLRVCSWPWLSIILLFHSCLVLVGSTEQGAERKQECRHWLFGLCPPQTVPVLYFTAQQVSRPCARKEEAIRAHCFLVWQKSQSAVTSVQLLGIGQTHISQNSQQLCWFM